MGLFHGWNTMAAAVLRVACCGSCFQCPGLVLRVLRVFYCPCPLWDLVSVAPRCWCCWCVVFRPSVSSGSTLFRVAGVARCAFALVWMGWWVDVFRCVCCWSGVGLGVCFVACVAYSAPFSWHCSLRLLRVVLLLRGSFVLRVADPATIRNPATFQ